MVDILALSFPVFLAGVPKASFLEQTFLFLDASYRYEIDDDLH